jgi:uncharacterized protein
VREEFMSVRVAERASIQDAGIASRLRSHLAGRARALGVVDVRIGLGYTAVVLDDGHAGVAYTFRDQARSGCSVLDGARPLSGSPAADLLCLLESPDAIEAGVGLGCANALANRDLPEFLGGDILKHLEVRPDDDVAMIGHFGPLAGAVRARARSLTIFERVEEPTEVFRPQHEASAALPRCQIALITAASVINHTIDDLLEAAKGCREVVLLGASTPLSPVVFEASPVTMLSGILVTASEGVLRVVSEGGGMRQLNSHVRKVTVKVNRVEPTLVSPGSPRPHS